MDSKGQRKPGARSRRAFLTMGIAAAAGYEGWNWLRSRPPEGGVEWPLRAMLRGNEKIAGAYFSNDHLSPIFAPSQVDPRPRLNGDVGLGDDLSIEKWVLCVQRAGEDSLQITMAEIRELPQVEQITELNCIEGWTVVVRWAGVRFSEFTERFAPQSRTSKYVSMQTPDRKYFVGLDGASAMHPQTLLCYEMNGANLTSAHGAPPRLVIPVKYGVKNIKRIGEIVYANERPNDYWANEGYDWYAGL